MEPEAIHDLTPAYALDALDADEAAEFEEHLAPLRALPGGARRPPGGREHARLRDSSGRRPAGAARTHPRAGSGGALERHSVPAEAPPDERGCSPRRHRSRRPRRSGSGSGRRCSTAISARACGAREAERRARPRRRARNRPRRPDPEETDRWRSGPTGRGVLVIPGLPKAPAGRTYEAWVIKGTKPSPAGLFLGAGSGTTVVPLTRPVEPGSVVAVTVEPRKGSAQPTQQPFITAKLS